MPNPKDDINAMRAALFNPSAIGKGLNAAASAGAAIQSAAEPVIKAVKSADKVATKAVDDFVSRTRKRMGY